MSAEWKKGFTDAEIANLKLSHPEYTEIINGIIVPTVSKEELTLWLQRYPRQMSGFMRGELSEQAMADATHAMAPAAQAELRARYPSMA